MSDVDNRIRQLEEKFEERTAALSRQVGVLEDIHAVRTLHFKYGYYMDKCLYDETVELFSSDAVIYFLNGVYRGREGARRLYCEWFRNLFTRGHNGPVDGFLLDHLLLQDIVDIAPDRQTARGRFRNIMQGGVHDRVLNYNMLWQANYEEGWAHSGVHLPPLEKTYPDDPKGPDELLPEVPPTWPKTRVVPFHYPHPVTGEKWKG
ncbi:MAG: nuclear transport factor 2 family protein [Gammaproteobacteria bacterium]